MARPRTFDEQAVLDGAVELFRRDGYEGTSVPRLTEELGICRQSLYNAFGDKRGLYLRALERWGEREIDTKLALLNGEGSPLDNLRTFVRAWAALATTCPVEGCLTIGGILEMRGDADALAVVEGQVARLEGGLSDAIAAARSAGEIREDVVPSRLARSLLASYYGLGVLARLPQSGQLVADAVAAALDQVEAAASR